MNEKFNKNANLEKFSNILGITVRLIVIDPLHRGVKIYLQRVHIYTTKRIG